MTTGIYRRNVAMQVFHLLIKGRDAIAKLKQIKQLKLLLHWNVLCEVRVKRCKPSSFQFHIQITRKEK